MIKLNQMMLELLRESLMSNRPDLVWVIEKDELIELDIALANELRDAVGDELIKRGLDEDDEPNDLGLKLEDLIDYIGRLAKIT